MEKNIQRIFERYEFLQDLRNNIIAQQGPNKTSKVGK